jgi:hypothetical protein
MGYTAKEFARISGVPVRKVSEWYDAGYLFGATRNERTKVYDIPKDTPVPYNANKKVCTLPTLRRDILIAASSQQIIFESMYPLFKEGTVESEIASLEKNGMIEVRYTESGACYLHLCHDADSELAQLTAAQKKDFFEKVVKSLSDGLALAKALQTLWPLIQPYLEQMALNK